MNKINWKLRFQNKTTLTAIIVAIVNVVYTILSMCGIAPSVDKNAVVGVLQEIIMVLCLMGIVTDPTTHGISDSDNAMTYTVPKK